MKAGAKNMTVDESLEIITAMIREAKGNVRRKSFFFLFWGWVAVLANLAMYTLSTLGYQRPYIVWLIAIPAWIFTFYKVARTKKTRHVATHLDRITGRLWTSFGLSIFLLVLFGSRINFQINALVLITAAIPTIVSGIILRFKPFMFGGLVFWLSGAICFLVDIELQPLVAAVGIAGGYLVPGYMLKFRKDDNV